MKLGPAHPRLGRAAFAIAHPALRAYAAVRGFFTADSAFAADRSRALRGRLARGEPAYLIGLGAGGHDSGAALVEVTARGGLRLVSSHEEERFTGVKHEEGPPRHSLAQIRADLDRLGLYPKDVVACLASFDYVRMFAGGVRCLFEELPGGAGLVRADVYPGGLGSQWRALGAPRLLRELLPASQSRLLGLDHHANHASFAWALSPFAHQGEAVLVLVLDATGDRCAISVYEAREAKLRLLHQNDSFWDSLGHYYALLSSSFGGWPIGSAEGRWMAAAAFGNQDPSTNRFYRPLRDLLRTGPSGAIWIDRSLARWHLDGARRPFSQRFLRRLALDPTTRERRWEGLCFDPGARVPEAADLAAASQLVFDEALGHLTRHWVGATSARRVILTGGTALNCVASAKLLAHNPGLQLWIPPAPADEGTPAGAAMHFALQSGARPGAPLAHAFYCGDEPSAAEIEAALRVSACAAGEPLADSSGAPALRELARLLALIVADDGVVGLFRGRAEIGRRALGHRSIFANPGRAAMRDRLNRVKLREPFRPFSPVCTLREATRWFHFDQPPDAEAGTIYRWMALAVRAKSEAFEQIPAALHVDGSARLQIASQEDALLTGFLEALGRSTGAEVALNTSLNLQGPIVQTPARALRLFERAPGLDAILFVAREGAFLAWPNAVSSQPAVRARTWLDRWRRQPEIPALKALSTRRG